MKIMVNVAHPSLAASRVNQRLSFELRNQSSLLVRDLYREYPNWDIDVEKEQRLLLAHDRIVLQFPFYWYSCPPLLKKWFDDVLTFGWAFGPQGDHLKGKEFVLATSAGGRENTYRSGGDNWFTISELLKPIQRTITRCNGTLLPSFVTYNVSQATDSELEREAARYAEHVLSPASALVH